MGLLGILLILLAAYGLSRDRGAVQWRVVWWGLGLQAGLAVLLLKTPARVVFEVLGAGFNSLMGFAEEGSMARPSAARIIARVCGILMR